MQGCWANWEARHHLLNIQNTSFLKSITFFILITLITFATSWWMEGDRHVIAVISKVQVFSLLILCRFPKLRRFCFWIFFFVSRCSWMVLRQQNGYWLNWSLWCKKVNLAFPLSFTSWRGTISLGESGSFTPELKCALKSSSVGAPSSPCSPSPNSRTSYHTFPLFQVAQSQDKDEARKELACV